MRIFKQVPPVGNQILHQPFIVGWNSGVGFALIENHAAQRETRKRTDHVFEQNGGRTRIAPSVCAPRKSVSDIAFNFVFPEPCQRNRFFRFSGGEQTHSGAWTMQSAIVDEGVIPHSNNRVFICGQRGRNRIRADERIDVGIDAGSGTSDFRPVEIGDVVLVRRADFECQRPSAPLRGKFDGTAEPENPV